MPNLDDHRRQIRRRLEEFGSGLAETFPELAWHIEDIDSRVLALNILLVLAPKARTTDELVVVAVTLSLAGGWSIDTTQGDGTSIYEETGLTQEVADAMLADPGTAGSRVAFFLTRSEPFVTSLMSRAFG